LIGILGGALGLLLTVWTCDWIHDSIVRALQRISDGAIGVSLNLAPDWRVFSYTAILSILAGVAVGLWPAIRAARTDLNSTLKQEATGTGRAGRSRWRSRNALLAGQVAGCLILLVGAGLLFRGVQHLETTNPGFDTRHVFLLGVNPKPIAATP